MTNPRHFAAIFSAILMLFSIPRPESTTQTQPNNFMVRLLPGYRVQNYPTLDTVGAKIYKKGGLEIEYSSGSLMEEEASAITPDKILWKTKQIINGYPLTCVYTRSSDFVATFNDKSPTNFHAHIKSNQDLAEMLLIVLTYEPTKGYPISPDAIEPTPKSKPNR